MKKTLLSIACACTLINSNGQWINANSPSATGVHGLTVTDGKLFAATDNGVYYTTDGSTWTNSSTGLPVTSGFTFNKTLRRFGNDMYSGTLGKLYVSTDFGANWTFMPGAGPGSGDHATFYLNSSVMLSGWASSGGLYYSTNGGTTWSGCAGLPS
ncbi:MAG TPA: hypothetical protein VD905_03425, partial [Flavobacteriales bacterium]|nr:hypothetical protein [Flavobacteriales bacterium]